MTRFRNSGAPWGGAPLLLLPAALLAVTLLGGCADRGGSSPRQTGQPPPIELPGTRWALVSLAGAPPESEQPITLELGGDGRASGFAGINRYFGGYQLQKAGANGGRLRFAELGATRMAGPEPLMKQETAYLELLGQTDGFVAEGGLLELTAGGAPTLRFRQLGRAKPQ